MATVGHGGLLLLNGPSGSWVSAPAPLSIGLYLQSAPASVTITGLASPGLRAVTPVKEAGAGHNMFRHILI